jgi:prefoldin alpha subunit
MAEGKKEIKVTGRQLLDAYRSDQAKLEALQRRGQGLQQALMEMAAARDAVQEIAKTKEGENAMISLGAGVFAEAKIANAKRVKNSLAGNVLIEEDAEKVAAELEKEMEKMKKELTQTQAEMQKLQENMRGITEILQQGQRAAQESGKAEVSSVS